MAPLTRDVMPKGYIYLVIDENRKECYTGMRMISREYRVGYRTLQRHLPEVGWWERGGLRVEIVKLNKQVRGITKNAENWESLNK